MDNITVQLITEATNSMFSGRDEKHKMSLFSDLLLEDKLFGNIKTFDMLWLVAMAYLALC